ncbi:MAG TPA: hypothetical protein VGR60_03635 [Gemmatimonadales bacterium]|nr:hypothetical protein [Gemmatimonadales bacterium]
MRRGRTALFAGGAAAGLALGWLLARRHIGRHRADLFSLRPWRRLSALAGLAGTPRIETVRLLRDYLAWEPRPLLRRRARAILRQMEAALG